MPLLPLTTHLRIFPSRRAASRALQRSAAEVIDATAYQCFDALVQGLGHLAGRRYAPPMVRRLLVRELLATDLGYWRSAAHEPVRVAALDHALMELRAAGVTSGHLGQSALSPALAELTALLGRYERQLDELGFADDADRARAAVLRVATGTLPVAWQAVQTVVVEGGADLRGARLDLLRAFAARGVHVEVRLPWDSDRKELFQWSELSLAALEARPTTALEVRTDPRTMTGPLAAFRAAHFGGGVAADAPVTAFSVAGVEEENRWAVNTVRRWLGMGIAADEMVLATPELGGRQEALLAALRRAGIAAYSPVGRRLLATRAGRVLEGVASLGQSDFRREDLLDLWADLGREVVAGEATLDAVQCARWVRLAGVRSARVAPYSDTLNRWAKQQRGQIPAFARATGQALDAVIGMLRQDDAPQSYSARVEQLTRVVAGLGLAVHSPQWPEDPDGALAARRAVLLESAAELAGLADVASFIEELAAGRVLAGAPWRAREFSEWVSGWLHERQLPSTGFAGGSVLVTRLEELVETSYSRVCLFGIDGERFPSVAVPDPILTEELRAEVNQRLGPRLTQATPGGGATSLHANARDKWLWAEALASAGDELVLTYSAEIADEGPSEVVEELYRTLGRRADAAPPASYAQGSGQTTSGLVWQWSLVGLHTGARLAEPMPHGLAMAVGDELRAANAGTRLAEIELRVGRERQVVRAGVMAPLTEVAQAQLRAWHEARPLRTSALDGFGVCAFRYVARTVFGLEREEVPSLGPDAAEQGTAAHAALYLVYRDLMAHGGLVTARRDRDAALQRARTVVEAAADDVLREVVIHPALRGAALESAWAAVERILRRDLDTDEARELLTLEFRFDERPGAHAPSLLVDMGRGLTLRIIGGIDRVDRVGASLVVTDYKRTLKERPAGRHFQLPLYGLAALRQFGVPVAIHAQWLGLRDAKAKVAEDLPSAPQDLPTYVAMTLGARLHRLFDGQLAPDPMSEADCRGCEMAPLCRYDVRLTTGGGVA